MDSIERQPLPAPGAQPITENDRQWLHDAIGKALKNVLSGPQSYYPDDVQEDSQDMGADLDNFIKSLENFRNNYVIDPSDVMGPMVDQLKERVKEFKKFHEDKTNDPMVLPREISPDTRDNRWIEVDPFPGPFSPPVPWSPSQRPKFRNASAPLPDDTGSQSDNSTPVAYPRLLTRVLKTDLARNDLPNQPVNPAQADPPLGIYSGKPMRQWIVPPPIWRTR
jgi:hypothetical protein